MEFDDELILFLCKIPSLEVRPQIVYPSKAAALPASKQTCMYITVKDQQHDKGEKRLEETIRGWLHLKFSYDEYLQL